MVVPEWGAFLVMVAASGGAIALVLLDLLIAFAPDKYDAWIEAAKPYLAMLFSFLVPQVVAVVQEVYPTVDPWLWAIVYAVGSYGVHELLYRLLQKPVQDRIAKA